MLVAVDQEVVTPRSLGRVPEACDQTQIRVTGHCGVAREYGPALQHCVAKGGVQPAAPPGSVFLSWKTRFPSQEKIENGGC